MRYLLAIGFLIGLQISSFAQYKNDNVLYKTVFLEDLCQALQENENFILLDVRSEGEYEDTSQYSNLNIGHFKNAINININELPARINELAAYKQTPVFVYCSHSQRSRRASKMLADSGYTKVFNINGGVSSFQLMKNNLNPCPAAVLETKLAYSIESPQVLYDPAKDYFIIDIRSDSVYNGTTKDERKKAYGKFEGVTHIPFSQFSQVVPTINTGKNILLIDDYGNESPKAAQMLVDKGYKNVSILFNGMDAFVQYIPARNEHLNLDWSTPVAYRLITGRDFDGMMRQQGVVPVIDVRSKDEFNNQSKNHWQNIGNIVRAINIPVDKLDSNSLKHVYKYPDVIIYSFSTNDEVFEAARKLNELGYKSVNVLLGGIFNLRWRAANYKGLERWTKYVINVPVENQ
jgi:rhodanese-related sulfurtransferase